MKKVERRFFLKSSAAVSAFVIVNPGFGMGSDAYAANYYSSDDSVEIALNRKWAEDSFSQRFPFSFVYGGKNSADFLDKWKRQVKDEKIDSSKRRRTLILNDPETGLEVRAIATIYTDTAGVDWTLHFTNKGSKDTPVLEQVKAVDVAIDPGDLAIHLYCKGFMEEEELWMTGCPSMKPLLWEAKPSLHLLPAVRRLAILPGLIYSGRMEGLLPPSDGQDNGRLLLKTIMAKSVFRPECKIST